MEIQGIFGFFHKIGEWTIKLVYVNILWLLFTALGLIILGFMPATTALFSTITKWMKKEEFPVFLNYWQDYKAKFKESNLMGLIITSVGLSMYWYFSKLLTYTGLIYQTIVILFVLLFLLYFLMVLYMFPVMSAYNFKFWSYFKHCLLFSLVSPLATITMVVALFLTVLFMITIPNMIALFGISLIAFIIVFSANIAFEKVTKLEKHNNSH